MAGAVSGPLTEKVNARFAANPDICIASVLRLYSVGIALMRIVRWAKRLTGIWPIADLRQ